MEVDLTISVCIDFFDNSVPDLLFFADVMTKDGRNFSCLDGTTTISVEKGESGLQVCFVQQLILIDCGSTPLTEVECTIIIHICSVKNFKSSLVYRFRFTIWEKLAIGDEEFFLLNYSVTICIDLSER